MVAKAPTCSTCGAVLIGYGWSEELNFQVHFCAQCRAKEETARPKVKKLPMEMGVLEEAA